MSADPQVARLEALLARVHSRRDMARAAPSPAAAQAASAEAEIPAEVTTPVPTSSVVQGAHLPPPAPPTPMPHAEADVDVEVSAETAEVDLDSIEAEELAAESLAEGAGAFEPAVDEVEELPASSKRPIHVEPQLAELAFGDAAPKATHPAPPESGRQVALPATDFEGELSGVRPLVESPAAPPAVRAPASTMPQPPAASLKPDVTRPPAPAPGPAAVFRGAVPESKPQTFGELLDTTLDL